MCCLGSDLLFVTEVKPFYQTVLLVNVVVIFTTLISCKSSIFSAPEPKAQVHYNCDHALSVVCPSVHH